MFNHAQVFQLEILESTRNRGNNLNQTNPTNAATRESGDFEELIRQHILQGDEDNQDNGTLGASEWQNQKISELFDFGSPLWSSRYSNFASMSFEEELELYDLLELDALGEEDQERADIDLDGTMQDILGA
jgi:hypothetical protein